MTNHYRQIQDERNDVCLHLGCPSPPTCSVPFHPATFQNVSKKEPVPCLLGHAVAQTPSSSSSSILQVQSR